MRHGSSGENFHHFDANQLVTIFKAIFETRQTKNMAKSSMNARTEISDKFNEFLKATVNMTCFHDTNETTFNFL